MDVRVFLCFGIFVTGTFLVTVSAQTCTSIRDCNTCVMRNNVNTCLVCNDRYAITNDSTGCCRCFTDDKGYNLCNPVTGKCTFEGCLTGFYGLNCVPCSNLIENCDVCGSPLTQPESLECIACATGFFTTTNKKQCCPLGCDTCNGITCTSCKPSYYLYNDKCDSCGNNCRVPTDGSKRCDPISGTCYLGCNSGWHGSKCDVRCNLTNCNTCTYNEPAKNLTCATCNAGYYDPYCAPCNVNCRPLNTSGDPRVCSKDGSCLYDCQPGWSGSLCNIRCDAATNLTNCLECSRYDFTCFKCKNGFWGNQCQFTCNQYCDSFLGEKVCNITHGACEFGCLSTHYKYDCSGSCPNCGNDVCDRNTVYINEDTSSSSNVVEVAAGTVGGVVVLVVVTITAIVYKRRKGLSKTNEDTSSQNYNLDATKGDVNTPVDGDSSNVYEGLHKTGLDQQYEALSPPACKMEKANGCSSNFYEGLQNKGLDQQYDKLSSSASKIESGNHKAYEKLQLTRTTDRHPVGESSEAVKSISKKEHAQTIV